MASITFTSLVAALRTRAGRPRARWRRCSSLQASSLQRPRALPAHPMTACSGAFNYRF
ncbi:MAG: hypothetical protein LBE78_04760 [Burkholderiaceae bacterium]|nr:hypothetical protein [Burkholderiaceae bacterium]